MGEYEDDRYEMGEVAREASEIVSSERDSHGDAYLNHKHIAKMWSAFLDHGIKPWEAAAMMSMVKWSRAKQGFPIRDHFVDVAGYADVSYRCAWEEGELADDE